jgi:hypothetical protein
LRTPLVEWPGQLGDKGLLAKATYIRKVEQLGGFKEKLRTLIIALLDKPDGDRPIGIFCTDPRVWTRARKPIPAEWERANADSWFAGQKGSTCEDMAWEQAFWAGHATSTGKQAASALLDLVNAYEQVEHCHVRAANAGPDGLHGGVLEILLDFYATPRIVSNNGAQAPVVYANRTIVAGCRFATTLLRSVLKEPLRRVNESNPSSMMKVNS